jgi:hypothetical protein
MAQTGWPTEDGIYELRSPTGVELWAFYRGEWWAMNAEGVMSTETLREMEYKPVRRDDEMKVTQKRLRAAGWTYNAHDRAWYRGKQAMPYVVFYNNRARLQTWSGDVAPRSMGHLRQLLSALGTS